MSQKEEINKRSKVGKRAKRKGGKAQREVAKILGLWFFNNPDTFHSTPGSGSLRWKIKVAGTRGDIVAPSSLDWPFSIEIKNQEHGEWDFYSLLLNQGPILNSWWKQCYNDAREANKSPWLIFTRNRLTYFSMLPSSFLSLNEPPLKSPLKKLPRVYFKLNLPESPGFIISTLGSLLANNPGKYNQEDHNEVYNKLIYRHILRVSEL